MDPKHSFIKDCTVLLFFNSVDVTRARRMLQTHILWNWKSQMYGNYAESCLCQQMCLLLEVGYCFYAPNFEKVEGIIIVCICLKGNIF